MDGTLHTDFWFWLLVSDFRKSVWSVPSIPVAVLVLADAIGTQKCCSIWHENTCAWLETHFSSLWDELWCNLMSHLIKKTMKINKIIPIVRRVVTLSAWKTLEQTSKIISPGVKKAWRIGMKKYLLATFTFFSGTLLWKLHNLPHKVFVISCYLLFYYLFYNH